MRSNDVSSARCIHLCLVSIHLLKQPVVGCHSNQHHILGQTLLIKTGTQSSPALLYDGTQAGYLNGLDKVPCQLHRVANNERPETNVHWSRT